MRGLSRIGRSALLLVLAASPGLAATVEISVVDEEGFPIADAAVALRPIGVDRDGFYRGYRRGRTDTTGGVTLNDVPPGQYNATAKGPQDQFIDPGDNPLTGPVTVTIDAQGPTVRVRLELHRGTVVCTRFVIHGSGLDRSAIVYRHEIETGHRDQHALLREDERCEPFFAGRWELTLEPPRGYVLVALEVDGSAHEGHVATVDLRLDPRARYVTWYFVARARLLGRVTFDGERIGVQIQAELLEGGPWQPAADERGGSLYTPVLAGPDRRGDYVMDLPDGRWRVRAIGDSVLESDPPPLEIALTEGEQRRLDFTVRGEPGEDERHRALRIFVTGPDGGLEDAVVELWPAGDDELPDGEPLARQRTGDYSVASFRDLAPGKYRAVAGHGKYDEATVAVTFDPDDPQTHFHTVRLEPAASLIVRVESEQDVRDARVQVARAADDPLVTKLTDPQVIAQHEAPSAEPDLTQRAWIRGIYAGRHVVTGAASDVFLEFRENGDGDWSRELELAFDRGQAREVVARLVQAGSVEGSLFCRGEEPLPALADVAVVPSTARPDDPLDERWTERAALLAERVLEGRHRDAFVAGPLHPDSYLVAVRPAAFDRWTWAVGTENGDESQSFEVGRGKAVALGSIGIECGPAVRVTVDVESGAASPDLSTTRWDSHLALDAVVVTKSGKRFEVERPRVERHARLLVLRDFETGNLEGRLLLGHPYFLPDYWVPVTLDGELAQGRTLDVRVPIADVGGAIDVIDTRETAVACRIVPTDGRPRIDPLAESETRLGNVPAGRYRVELCGDPECRAVVHAWDAIDVEPARTLRLAR